MYQQVHNKQCCECDRVCKRLTPVQKRYVRNISVFFLISGSLLMLIIGAIWAKYDSPTCGTAYHTAQFSITPTTDLTLRKFEGNSCPGYDWRSQSTSHNGHQTLAGEHKIEFFLTSSPRINRKPFYVGKLYPMLAIDGPIGYALNGIAIYSPVNSNGDDAVLSEGGMFDQCGGHNEPSEDFTFTAKIPGFYHYHSMPGDSLPLAHDRNAPTTSINFCRDAKEWYIDSSSHSPLVGFLADGIPIYGPRVRLLSALYTATFIILFVVVVVVVLHYLRV